MPSLDLTELLEGAAGALDETRRKIGGVVLGVVSDTDDPLSLGRIKVRLPWLSASDESAWAPVAVPWVGSEYGAYLAPEVDDVAVIAFDQGSLQHPIVIGFLWGTQVRPPEASPRLERRVLKSSSGHKLQFDDQPGVGAIRLESGTGHKVLLDDTPPGTITVEHASGTVKISLDPTGITIQADSGNLTLSAPAGSLQISGASVSIQATGTLSIQGGATVSIDGALVTIN